jgi:plasmid maintenance system antidote protein VapI
MNFKDVVQRVKSEYGVNQTALAKHMRISPQILTDIKAGRRRFSVAMAESIMSLFAHEPDAGWLAEALQAVLAENGGTETSNADAMMVSTARTAGTYLPVSDALCNADSQMTVVDSGRTVLIPVSLTPFLEKAAFSYVFVLDYDDYAGRLRAGDQILIVQHVNIIREIMVIESNGRLRLARNDTYLTDSTQVGAKEKWLALDTGKPVAAVSLIGAAVGIVSAVL